METELSPQGTISKSQATFSKFWFYAVGWPQSPELMSAGDMRLFPKDRIRTALRQRPVLSPPAVGPFGRLHGIFRGAGPDPRPQGRTHAGPTPKWRDTDLDRHRNREIKVKRPPSETRNPNGGMASTALRMEMGKVQVQNVFCDILFPSLLYLQLDRLVRAQVVHHSVDFQTPAGHCGSHLGNIRQRAHLGEDVLFHEGPVTILLGRPAKLTSTCRAQGVELAVITRY